MRAFSMVCALLILLRASCFKAPGRSINTLRRAQPTVGFKLPARHGQALGCGRGRTFALGASSIVADAVAKNLGYVMGAGSTMLYAPIITKVVKARSAEGLAISGLLSNLLGYSFSAVYSTRRGFPLSTYVETLMLAAQSGVLIFLAGYFAPLPSETATFIERRPRVVGAAFTACYLTAIRFLLSPVCPTRLLTTLQAAATSLVSFSLVPQVLKNFRRQSTGQWSWITAGLSVCGNAIRIFTTLRLTRDKLLFVGFLNGFCLNSLLLFQILRYSGGVSQ